MATYYVDDVNGDDLNDGLSWATAKATIQAGLDLCGASGDEVIVADGTYTGVGNKDLDFGGNSIHLQSQNGPDNCILDAEGDEFNPHQHFIFDDGEDEAAIVNGFTLINAYFIGGASSGGSILITNGEPTILNCIIRNNEAAFWGGGIHIDPLNAVTVKNCIFEDNAAGEGAAICNYGGILDAENCIFVNHSRGSSGATVVAACYEDASAATLTNCLIADNNLCALKIDGIAIITNCTIANNITLEPSGMPGGAIIDGYFSPDPEPGIIDAEAYFNNSIMWGNDSFGLTVGKQLSIVIGSDPVVEFDYCCYDDSDLDCNGDCHLVVFTNTIFDDPLFVDPAEGDFRLQEESPCVDTGENTYNDTEYDLDGNPRIYNEIIDMGCFEWQPLVSDGYFYLVSHPKSAFTPTIFCPALNLINRAKVNIDG